MHGETVKLTVSQFHCHYIRTGTVVVLAKKTSRHDKMQISSRVYMTIDIDGCSILGCDAVQSCT